MLIVKNALASRHELIYAVAAIAVILAWSFRLHLPSASENVPVIFGPINVHGRLSYVALYETGSIVDLMYNGEFKKLSHYGPVQAVWIGQDAYLWPHKLIVGTMRGTYKCSYTLARCIRFRGLLLLPDKAYAYSKTHFFVAIWSSGIYMYHSGAWIKISGPVALRHCESLAFAHGILFAATTAGLFESVDYGEKWLVVGPPYAVYSDVVAWKSWVIAAKWGKGLTILERNTKLVSTTELKGLGVWHIINYNGRIWAATTSGLYTTTSPLSNWHKVSQLSNAEVFNILPGTRKNYLLVEASSFDRWLNVR